MSFGRSDAPRLLGEPRRLSGWLLSGVLALPVIFVWLLLRRGYSRDVRLGAFLYAVLFPALRLTVRLIEDLA